MYWLVKLCSLSHVVAAARCRVAQGSASQSLTMFFPFCFYIFILQSHSLFVDSRALIPGTFFPGLGFNTLYIPSSLT